MGQPNKIKEYKLKTKAIGKGKEMGNRSNIVIRETASQTDNLVILYGHWAGDDNLTAVKNVLEKTDRIGDNAYLTAQIFYEFTRLGQYDGGLGYGLWVGDMETIDEADNPAVIIDCDTGAITYKSETVEPCECNSCVAFH